MAMECGPSRPLPFDLERHVFELAALSHTVSIPPILRVAWRVKHWIETLLYRTLVIRRFLSEGKIHGVPPCSVETFRRVVQTKPASFLRNAVRHLLFDKIGPNDVRFILHACPAVTDLFFLVVNKGLPDGPAAALTFESMAPTKMYGHPETIFTLTHCASFHQPIFSQLTHFQLFGPWVGSDPSADEEYPLTWTDLASLPSLTHLALTVPSLIPVCSKILRACPDLRALLILNGFFDSPPAELADDPRFVIVPQSNYEEDWVRGAVTGMDYWARADVHIAKRISGEVARNIFWL
ncbi:hypothetical protein DFH09DRAFT_1363870 [Mycena vulgaris]|nr:hypothetical protein DFH09DRAFT_1363870 [Mycena vulgaris]